MYPIATLNVANANTLVVVFDDDGVPHWGSPSVVSSSSESPALETRQCFPNWLDHNCVVINPLLANSATSL